MVWSRTSDAAAATLRLLERSTPSIEHLFTSRDHFGVVTASPLQRAICRMADGAQLGDLARHPDVLTGIGEDVPAKPKELYIVSGSRVGKTLLSATVAYRLSRTVDVSALGPGDEPRVPILSLDKDKAKACYLHLVETMKQRPALRAHLIDEGTNELGAPAVWIRHESGRPVMVCVAAGKAAGNAVVSYFLAGCIFDEFCKMHGSNDAVVNFDDSRRNAVGRILPGGFLMGIGSPWAPFGPAYETVQKHWKKPTRKTVVVWARGRVMNPSWWTPERIAELDADVLLTEEEAKFRDAEESLIGDQVVNACTRAEPLTLPREDGHSYVAAMDPATRSNAWTLVVGTRVGGKRIIAFAKQWLPRPSEALSPRVVLTEIAGILERYGLSAIETDQWSTDALRDIARPLGVNLVEWPATAAENTEMYLELVRRMQSGEVELPPDPVVREDLLRAKRRVTQGGIAIALPKTADGRHCDFVPAIARMVRRFVEEPKKPEPKAGTPEHFAKEQARLLDAAKKKYGQKRGPWWKTGA